MTPLGPAVLATAVAAVVLAWTWVPTGGRALLRSTAREADLAAPVHDGTEVVRRLQARTSAAAVGLLLRLVLVALPVLLVVALVRSPARHVRHRLWPVPQADPTPTAVRP